MPEILCQMFFECRSGSRPCGWSEGFYNRTAPDLPSALGVVDPNAALPAPAQCTTLVQLALYRSLLLGAGVTMPYLRVSERTIFRDSQVDYGPAPGYTLVPPSAPGGAWAAVAIAGFAGIRPLFPLYNYGLYQVTPAVEIPGLICDFPWASYLTRMEGSIDQPGNPWTARRAYHVRGNPDIVQQTLTNRIDATTGIPTAAAWNTAMTNYAQALVNGTWGFKALDTSATNPPKAISAMSVDATTGKVTLTIPLGAVAGPPPVAAITVNPNDYMRLSGFVVVNGVGSRIKNLSKLWQVESVTGNVITFYNMKLPPAGAPYSLAQGGTARLQKYAVIPFRKVQPRWFSKKNTGSPFGVPVGRRSRRLQAALGTA